MSDTPNSSILRPALAISIGAAIGSAALNVLNEKYGAFIPDWTIVVAGYVALGFLLFWAWHTEFVRRHRKLIYTFGLMAPYLMVLSGAIIGGGAGWFLWWSVEREQRAQAELKSDSTPTNSTSTSPSEASQAAANSTPTAGNSNETETHFSSPYVSITNTPDTTISFISTREVGTDGRWLKFKARIGRSVTDGTRLVVDLPVGIEFEVGRYAVAHRDQILERVIADMRAANPDLLDIPLDKYMILQHHSGDESSPRIFAYASKGKGAEFLVENH